MYTYEYRFFPHELTEPETEDYVNAMRWFISALEKTGQILPACQNTVRLKDCFACRVVCPERDSLNEKYGSKYTKQFFTELLEISRKPPQLTCIGENYDVDDCCTCVSPSHYILYTECWSFAPPIICGDCKHSVPLYRFPPTYEGEEYYDLLQWQRVYQSCDRQFLEGTGERHGYGMMHNPASPLSKEALKYCSVLETQIGKPFYYFLFRYYSRNKLMCPKCGKPWANTEPDRIHYDCVCHTCRLVSNDP